MKNTDCNKYQQILMYANYSKNKLFAKQIAKRVTDIWKIFINLGKCGPTFVKQLAYRQSILQNCWVWSGAQCGNLLEFEKYETLKNKYLVVNLKIGFRAAKNESSNVMRIPMPNNSYCAKEQRIVEILGYQTSRYFTLRTLDVTIQRLRLRIRGCNVHVPSSFCCFQTKTRRAPHEHFDHRYSSVSSFFLNETSRK